MIELIDEEDCVCFYNATCPYDYEHKEDAFIEK